MAPPRGSLVLHRLVQGKSFYIVCVASSRGLLPRLKKKKIKLKQSSPPLERTLFKLVLISFVILAS